MTVCTGCGFENPSDARFCGECGNTLVSTELESAKPQRVLSEPMNVPRVLPQPSVDARLKVLIIIGTLFMPLVGIVMGIIFLSDSSPQHKEVGRQWLLLGIVLFVLWSVCVCTNMLVTGAGGTSSHP